VFKFLMRSPSFRGAKWVCPGRRPAIFCCSKTPIRDRAMPALLRGLDTLIVTEYNMVQLDIVRTMNLAPDLTDTKKEEGNKKGL
jgi:hypothetical protein